MIFRNLARYAAIAAGGLGLATVSSAEPRTSVTPYLEVEQVLLADLNDGDVLTYSTVAAGVDATAQTRQVEGQISYRYERRIAWEDDLADEDVHSGIAAVRYHAIPGTLAIEAGAMAARGRADASAPIFGFDTADDPSIADVYGIYAGPSLSTKVGAVDVKASYRLGYVKVDDHGLAGLPFVPGQTVSDRYDSAVNHSAAVSVGMDPGELPVGWTVGAGYVREDTNRLDQTYEAKYVRADVVVPVSPEVALTGGVGYEDIKQDQQDIARLPNGIPIITPGGRLVADPARPRLLAYDQSGVIWDAGVIYRPNRRTELQARVGQRYGGTTFTGSLRHQFSRDFGMSAVVYDSVDSFGRLIVADLGDVPTSFNVRRNGMFGGLGNGGCVFGSEAGQGVCFDDTLNAITTANFRNRGATILFSGTRGPWSFNAGAGYANRKYLAPVGFGLDRVSDESITLQASADRSLSRTSTVSIDGYASWYDSGVAGSDSVFGAGVTSSYSEQLLERLELQAALGLYTTQSEQTDAIVAQALLGLRYSF